MRHGDPMPHEFDALLSYSEWLDADQHLLRKPRYDHRTHEDLIQDYLEAKAQRRAAPVSTYSSRHITTKG